MYTSRKFGMVSCETRGNIRCIVLARRIDGDGPPRFIYKQEFWELGSRGEYVGLGEWRGGTEDALLKYAFGLNDHHFEFATEEQALGALNTVTA